MSTVKSQWSRMLNTRWIVSSTHLKSAPEPTSVGLINQKPQPSGNQSTISQSLKNTLRKIYQYSQTAESENEEIGKQSTPKSSPKKRPLRVPVVSESTLSFEDSILMTNESVREFYRPGQTSNYVLAISSQPTPEPVKTKTIDSTAERRVKLLEAKEQQLSQLAVIHRMKALTSSLMVRGISNNSRLTRLREVVDYAVTNPAACEPVREIGVVPFLLKLEEGLKSRLGEGNVSTNRKLISTIREGLSVMGYTPPIQSAGIRILTIDGGGTRGLVAIETLKQIEILSQKPIHQMFDYICGVSTGGLLAILVGGFKLNLDQCEAVYKDCSQRIFSRGTLAGAAGLLTKHSFYDIAVLEGILKDEIGESLTMLSTSKDEYAPKLGLLSTIRAGNPENFVFRNYNHDITATSQYPGTCDARIWEAVRASSAAPGYFEDFKLRDTVHQDGGVLNNNPTAIAIHEARTLWPNEKIQCVISLGNGRHETDVNNLMPSLRDKVGAFIQSATNTQVVHTVLSDLLEPDTYYRFNPYLTEHFQLDEIKEEKLQKMQFETQLYLRRNANKVKKAGQQLDKKRSKTSVVKDTIQHRYSLMGTRV